VTGGPVGGSDKDKDGHERPGQRDWREADRKKDRSTHRKDDKLRSGPRSKAVQQAAQKEYRAGLEKLFETGAAGGRVGALLSRMPAASAVEGGEGAERQIALRKIRAAETSSDAKSAVDAFRAKWDLPDDPDTLFAVLLHPDEGVVAEALAILDRVMPLKRATRRETMKARLRRTAENEDFSVETRALATSALSKA